MLKVSSEIELRRAPYWPVLRIRLARLARAIPLTLSLGIAASPHVWAESGPDQTPTQPTEALSEISGKDLELAKCYLEQVSQELSASFSKNGAARKAIVDLIKEPQMLRNYLTGRVGGAANRANDPRGAENVIEENIRLVKALDFDEIERIVKSIQTRPGLDQFGQTTDSDGVDHREPLMFSFEKSTINGKFQIIALKPYFIAYSAAFNRTRGWLPHTADQFYSSGELVNQRVFLKTRLLHEALHTFGLDETAASQLDPLIASARKTESLIELNRVNLSAIREHRPVTLSYKNENTLEPEERDLLALSVKGHESTGGFAYASGTRKAFEKIRDDTTAWLQAPHTQAAIHSLPLVLQSKIDTDLLIKAIAHSQIDGEKTVGHLFFAALPDPDTTGLMVVALAPFFRSFLVASPENRQSKEFKLITYDWFYAILKATGLSDGDAAEVAMALSKIN